MSLSTSHCSYVFLADDITTYFTEKKKTYLKESTEFLAI